MESDRSTAARGPIKTVQYRFKGRVIKLTNKDYDEWEKRYGHIPDFEATLEAADAYYAAKPPGDKWFHIVAAWLKRENDRMWALKRRASMFGVDSW